MNENLSAEMLEDVLCELLQKLSKCDMGSDEQEKLSKCVERLMKLKIDDFRAKAEWELGLDKLEQEKRSIDEENERRKQQKLNELIRIAIEVLKVVITCGSFAALTIWASLFEAKGCIIPKHLTKFADKIRIE